MSDTLVHRGPDDGGVWTDIRAGVALGFRRLSIVDLSPAGHQPMESASGRYVIVFNGEVYNYKDIRSDLLAQNLAPAFRGGSDTEVMLAAFDAWGVEAAVRRFVGMFAMAVWDRKDRIMRLVRDRMGIKPLYYGWCRARHGTGPETLLFGSELKALRAFSGFRGDIDRDALCLMMRHNYLPAPYTIYRGFYKLLPGTILTVNSSARVLPEPVPYWSARERAEAGVLWTGSERDAIEQMDEKLREAIRLRMVADVPLGAFLSGGVDSSLVVALMQAQSTKPVKTFTIGFHSQGFDEAKNAKEVARHLGADHTELYLSAADVQAVIPRLPRHYDEPFSDSSQIPTLLVSELARKHVTVALSGDGGDELFGGYNRYFCSPTIWKKIGWIPRGLRKALASGLSAVPPDVWTGLFDRVGSLIPGVPRRPVEKLTKVVDLMHASCPDEVYRHLVSHWSNPSSLVIGANNVAPPTVLSDPAQWARLDDFTQRMMYLDTVSYLPDDILVKVDRASMAVGLEARVPLIDHRVYEFAWSLPMNLKVRERQGKWLLRQILYQYVPQFLVDRPKMGFGVPIGDWLRKDLRPWAEELLSPNRLKQEGYLHEQPVREKWEEHLSGRRDWSYHLWDVLMFQAWLAEQRESAAPAHENSRAGARAA